VKGKRLASAPVTVFALRRPDDGPARLGLAVGRRCGGAAARNRIKRRLRAAWHRAGPDEGIDLVVEALPAAASAEFQELVNTVATAQARVARE
jgi:ribonuclease P protein component